MAADKVMRCKRTFQASRVLCEWWPHILNQIVLMYLKRKQPDEIDNAMLGHRMAACFTETRLVTNMNWNLKNTTSWVTAAETIIEGLISVFLCWKQTSFLNSIAHNNITRNALQQQIGSVTDTLIYTDNISKEA